MPRPPHPLARLLFSHRCTRKGLGVYMMRTSVLRMKAKQQCSMSRIFYNSYIQPSKTRSRCSCSRRARTDLRMSQTRTVPSAPPVTALPLPMHTLAQVTGPLWQPREAVKSNILDTFFLRKSAAEEKTGPGTRRRGKHTALSWRIKTGGTKTARGAHQQHAEQHTDGTDSGAMQHQLKESKSKDTDTRTQDTQTQTHKTRTQKHADTSKHQNPKYEKKGNYISYLPRGSSARKTDNRPQPTRSVGRPRQQQASVLRACHHRHR